MRRTCAFGAKDDMPVGCVGGSLTIRIWKKNTGILTDIHMHCVHVAEHFTWTLENLRARVHVQFRSLGDSR